MRRILVATGASSGLGFEAVKQLLRSAPSSTSYSIIVGARNVQPARRAYNSLSLDDRHFIFAEPLELSDLTSVKSFAARIKEELRDSKLDILLLSAAISKAASSEAKKHAKWSEAYRRSKVNIAGHQYLLHLLQDKLHSTRVAVVSSMLYKRVKDTESIEAILSSDSSASALDIYKTTKFVQLLQTARWRHELAGRAEVVAVSPGNPVRAHWSARELTCERTGFVPATGLSRETGTLASLAMRYILPLAPFATSLEEGGKAILRAMNDDLDLSDGHLLLEKTGQWDDLDGRVNDIALQEKWWLSKQDIEAFQQT